MKMLNRTLLRIADCIYGAAAGIVVLLVGSAVVDFPRKHTPGDVDLFFPVPGDLFTFLDRLKEREDLPEGFKVPDVETGAWYSSQVRLRIEGITYNLFTSHLDSVEQVLRLFDAPGIRVAYDLSGKAVYDLRDEFPPDQQWEVQPPDDFWRQMPDKVWDRCVKLYTRGCTLANPTIDYLEKRLQRRPDQYALMYMVQNKPEPNNPEFLKKRTS